MLGWRRWPEVAVQSLAGRWAVWVTEVTVVLGENDYINYDQHHHLHRENGSRGPAELRGVANSPDGSLSMKCTQEKRDSEVERAP